MKWNWQWFLGGQVMFWIATILLALFVGIYIVTYLMDPTTIIFMDIVNEDSEIIRDMVDGYLDDLGVTISKPIYCRFVKYKHEKFFIQNCRDDAVLLGTFHEWNNAYYIEISIDLIRKGSLYEVVRHETRHMVVQELKNKKIIDLTKYTEDIAQEEDEIYNELFDYSVKLLKKEQINE